MRQRAVPKVLLFGAMVLLALSVVLSVVSLYPLATGDEETSGIIDDSFRLTPLEMRRHGLGSFRGGENISVSVRNTANSPINFSIVIYNGTRYSNVSSADFEYSFTADANYYEAVFGTNSNTANEIHFEVSVQKPKVSFPFSWLATPAKVLFIFSLGSIALLLLKPALHKYSVLRTNELEARFLSQKSRRILLILILVSLAFWFFLLVVNINPFAGFENWYTDHARHPYSSSLFTKVGFSIFETPLGKLASNDSSYFKFVTWPEMPHLYPLGSIFLFLPFGFMLQSGVDQVFVFKMEIVVLLLFSHASFYYFLKRFWKQKMFILLKLLGIYALYVPLIVYSANGMFDAVPFLCSLIALNMYLDGRYDYFLLLMALSVTFKYQPAIFLFPLIIIGVLKLFEQYRFSSIIRNKAVIAAAVLAVIAAFTAFLSAPFLMETRPEFVMNGINAFSSHSQIPWTLQSFMVLLTLTVTLLVAILLLNKNPLISLSSIFVLLPSFTMPYFQLWYLPFFFGYAVIPKQKREMEVTMIWLIFIMVMLSFGGISFNPLHVLDGWKRVLGF
ncbi:MAG: hypothetical protein JSW44_01645 [Candidatus Bathyarchaeota archaeon]|nr:MAG: hypothetical protein JSW44_01645 [Candidatus Bathyarchaeota archaeon]